MQQNLEGSPLDTAPSHHAPKQADEHLPQAADHVDREVPADRKLLI
jgi:hypothetical protein